MLSEYGQFIPYALALVAVLVAVLIGIAWSIRRRAAPRTRGASTETRALEDMRVRDFEALVRESFRQQGYALIDPARGATEGGELILRRERETVLVQCRHWRDRKVGVEPVQALQRAMKQRGAGGGFVLTTGRFAREAVAFAASCNIRLIDGPALRGLIDKSTAAMPMPTANPQS